MITPEECRVCMPAICDIFVFIFCFLGEISPLILFVQSDTIDNKLRLWSQKKNSLVDQTPYRFIVSEHFFLPSLSLSLALLHVVLILVFCGYTHVHDNKYIIDELASCCLVSVVSILLNEFHEWMGHLSIFVLTSLKSRLMYIISIVEHLSIFVGHFYRIKKKIIKRFKQRGS